MPLTILSESYEWLLLCQNSGKELIQWELEDIRNNRFLEHIIEKGNVVMEALIAAGASITVGVLSLAGVIITNANSNRKIEQQLETAQAVTDCKIDELTREVREHNNFARRMPVVEEQIKVINHRIKDLEKEG